MPVYEYRCSGCERRFEALASIAARDDSATCPRCGQPSAERLVSLFAAFSESGGLPMAGGGCCGGSGGCACRG